MFIPSRHFINWRILFDAATDTGGTVDTTPIPAVVNGDGTDKGRSYTQAELNAMFGERAKQASSSAISNLLKELGVEKADDIKTALKKAKDAELAQLSELEKAQKKAADSEARIEAVEKEKAEITAAAAEKLLRAAVLVEAGKQGFNDPADAWLYIDRTKIEAKENDVFDGLEKAVKVVLEAKPYLAGAQSSSPRLGTPRAGERYTGKVNVVSDTLSKRYQPISTKDK